jgi:dTDP-glucose pyrophosphorylase
MSLVAKNWQKALLGPASSVRQAIDSLNRSSLQIVLVVTAGRKLLGTVTDGDIRRWLFQGGGWDAPIADVMTKNPHTVSSKRGPSGALALMQKHHLAAIPEVDQHGVCVGLHLLSEFIPSQNQRRENTFVIMAGGLGKRLRPITNRIPKPMVKIQGKPILQHILERAARDHFFDFVITTHHLGSQIRKFFGDGSRFGVSIRYLHESMPLGTAGALRNLKTNRLPVLVTNGDILANVSYGDMVRYHMTRKASATMAVKAHLHTNPFGVVEVQGFGIRGFKEKPVSVSYINAGIYVLEPAIFRSIPPRRRFDMPELFRGLIRKGRKAVVYPIHEPWADLGRKAELKKYKRKGLGK